MTVIKKMWSSEVGDHLVEVHVDLGELVGELLVLEGVALLMEELRNGGDQQQPVLGLFFGEVVVVLGLFFVVGCSSSLSLSSAVVVVWE